MEVLSYGFEVELRSWSATPTHLWRNISAGSMFTEVSRTTCRISLAIILSFSKLTRPSTLESLPGGENNERCRSEGVKSQVSTNKEHS